jgi:hypothetical protein
VGIVADRPPPAATTPTALADLGDGWPSLERAFPIKVAGAEPVNPDRTRRLLWSTVHADPPPMDGLALVQCLALAVLRAGGYAMRVDLATALALDAVMVLRQRRAPMNAQDRAAQLGMRKGRYLDLRGQLLAVVRRVIETGSLDHREPETSADWHADS